MKTIKIKKTPEDGKTSHVYGLAELILWKWLYYQKWSTDSMQCLSKSQCHSSQNYKNQS
jgi:hypothetical protein